MRCITPYFHKYLRILCPCRKCLPCTINRKRSWTTRAIFELMAHEFSTFLTLTYDDDHNPVSLRSEDLSNFWKRMRKQGAKFRYFACGEYGEHSKRPHYHAIIYGEDSAVLEQLALKCWVDKEGKALGFIYSVPATPESASYVAGYVTKKMADRSELLKLGLEPEFIRTSKGIGKNIIPAIAKFALVQNGALEVIDKLKIGDRDYPLPDYIKRKLREVVLSQEHIEALKRARIKDMQDFCVGLVEEFLGECEISNSKQVLQANALATKNDYLALLKKDRIWNSRSKV